MADLTRQTPATVPVTHYFDLQRTCRDCGRQFLFFAEEQKYWYEVLGFGLDSDCVRCADCRKKEQGIARDRETYEALFHVAEKTTEQSLEMAEACLSLIEANVFTAKQTQRVRTLLNAVADHDDRRDRPSYKRLVKRVIAIEQMTAQGGLEPTRPCGH